MKLIFKNMRDTAVILQKKILIVEDNKINRIMLKEILSPQYAVLEAENGQEALSVLEKCKDDISLILLDIIMPVMDGYTFLSHMKENPSYTSIPVIVTTQNDGESDEVAALSHGATDFIAKPYKPQVILHRVASIIKLRETAAIVNLLQYDRLTGLYSKTFFYQRAKELLIQNPNKEYDIICSDVENFKLTNDVFGVPTGDLLLCGIADLYATSVGEHGICSRFDADQFVCLLERRFVYTNEPFIQASAQINVLTSAKNIVLKWGIYPIEDRGVSVEQMCDRALLAARSIKGQYGKYFIIYNDELRDSLLQEQSITDSMETALADNQFEIYLQPKYRIQDEKLSGAEALVRWKHPEWGMQSPAVFIPLFEKNGFISKLDQYVWDKTCAILSEWEQKRYPPIPISVNVSRADIYQVDLSDILMKMIQKYNLSPSWLHLEITESAYTEDPNQIIETVGQLRKLGFIIEMDDFGSGYSSLNMLNRMPLDLLKLDIKFIQSETVKPINQEILRFIMELARWMNLRVVAEGVETREQLERLREIGCDYAQGYYFAKPMPCSEFETLLKEHSIANKKAQFEYFIDKEQQPPILLIVDEDYIYCNELKKTFEHDYQVMLATNYETTLNCISTYGRRIAMLILSMTLSNSDGFTILELFQKKKMIWNIPIIATAAMDLQIEEKALEMGVADFARKPHSARSLWQRVQRISNIVKLREQERISRDERYHDCLTGLLNRKGLDAAIRLIDHNTYPLTAYFFDLDNLKNVNDSLGYIAGDQLIMLFGALLRSHTKTTDIVVRFGGDEFLIILKQYGSEKNAIHKGSEICQATKDEHCLTEHVFLSCSVGIAIGNAENTVPEIITRAKQALHQAKKNNKGSYYIWEK